MNALDALSRALPRVGLAALLLLALIAACNGGTTTPEPTPDPARIAAFAASSPSVEVGSAVTFSWRLESAQAATSTCTLDADGDGTTDYTFTGQTCLEGSQSHTFTGAGTFTAAFRALSGGESLSQQVSVVVTLPDEEDPGDPGGLNIAAFAVEPTSAELGSPVTYSWHVDNARADTTCTLDVNGDGTPEYSFSGPACSSGSQAHTFTNADTFTGRLSVTAPGTSLSRQASVVITSPADPGPGPTPDPKIASFAATPTAVEVGSAVTFSWRLENAQATTTCTLDANGDGTAEYSFSGERCLSGSQSHSFAQTGTYSAVFKALSGGSDLSRSFSVTVTPPAEVPANFTNVAWTTARSQPYRVAEAQGVAVGGKLYIFGGFDSTKTCCTPTDRAYAYDPVANTFTALAPLPPMNNTGRGGVTHAGIASDGTDIYLVSGYTANATGTGQIFGTREAWRYTVASNSYTRLPDLPATRSAGQLEYLNGKLHYFGGTNSSRTRDTGEHYVLALQGGTSWTTAAPLPNPRNHMGSAVLGGRIYAVAGQHGHDHALVTQSDVHAYDPATDTWEARASLPKAVSHISSMTFVMGERIIVLGGEIAHGSPIANAYAYSPDTNAWTPLTNLPRVLRSAVADVVNGKIILTGGSGGGTRAETYVGVPTR